MTLRTGKIVLLVAVFALATSVAGFASAPCGVTNQIYCQGEDATGILWGSQNDTAAGGFGGFATAYDHFTLSGTVDVESFHWVGGYFNPPTQGPISAWTLTFYADNAGTPGSPIATGFFPGNANETLLADGLYQYSVFFQSFDMSAGTYWASVVPDLAFPPEWGWATSTDGNNAGYQCFFGTCGTIGGTNFAFAVDGTTPEPGTLVMLGTGVLGLAGTLRRKLF